jgi:hypothetical protein
LETKKETKKSSSETARSLATEDLQSIGLITLVSDSFQWFNSYNGYLSVAKPTHATGPSPYAYMGQTHSSAYLSKAIHKLL